MRPPATAIVTLVLSAAGALCFAGVTPALAAETTAPVRLSADLGVGISHVLEKSDYGDAAYQVLATAVRARVRLPDSHVSVSLTYVHFQQLSSSGPIRFAFDAVGAGLGYEIDAGRIAIRPEALLAYGMPTPKVSDPTVDPGDTSGGLTYGAGVSVTYPRRGPWFVAFDAQLLHKGRTDGSLTFFTGLADFGLRWSL